jgi:mannose/fructose/N-acetylgalactosamine-specific phosphotransferase system component IID
VVKKSSNFEQIFAFFWCFFYHKNLCKFFMRKKQKLNDSLDEKTNFLIK